MHDITISTSTNLGPVGRGQRFVQRFVARDDDLLAISVWAATYRKQIVSTATLTLLDETGETVLRRAERQTANFADNTWQRFAFDPVSDCKGRTFYFAFETDGYPEAITLWTNNHLGDPCATESGPYDAAICYKTHFLQSTHAALDPIVPHLVASAPPLDAERRELLHDLVQWCISHKEYFLLRLMHLLDALNQTEGVQRILSVGSGETFHEAFLAARFGQLDVHATDLNECHYAYDLDNLRFSRLDILNPEVDGGYDFVFSIECLEHIEDHARAFANMAALVRPGGYLYASVPFASREEQRDEKLKAYAWDVAKHYLPGFDFETLEGYFTRAGFDVLHSANMFDVRVSHSVNGLLDLMDAGAIPSAVEHVVRLFTLDLEPRRVASIYQAEGVKVLGRRR